jgi:ADP-ribosylglycohydrolase
MLGAIIGDVYGSAYEGAAPKTKDLELPSLYSSFTDDSVMTVAVAQALTEGQPYADCARGLGTEYPDAGFGGNFLKWLFTPGAPAYGSWGNGSAMRVSPVAWAFDSEAAVLQAAADSAAISHDHPEGLKGAQATALAIFLARTGSSKEEIRQRVADFSGYDLDRRLDDIRPGYKIDVSCQGSVPEAIIAFLESTDFEDCIRNAISLGGDTDTQAAIAGSIAEAWHGGVPADMLDHTLGLLSPRLLRHTASFCSYFRPGPDTDRVAARLKLVDGALRTYPRFIASPEPSVPDCATVRFTGRELGRNKGVLQRQLAGLVLAGWTRLCLDCSALERLDARDVALLRFIQKSCAGNYGALAVENLSPALRPVLTNALESPRTAWTTDRAASLDFLHEARSRSQLYKFIHHG